MFNGFRCQRHSRRREAAWFHTLTFAAATGLLARDFDDSCHAFFRCSTGPFCRGDRLAGRCVVLAGKAAGQLARTGRDTGLRRHRRRAGGEAGRSHGGHSARGNPRLHAAHGDGTHGQEPGGTRRSADSGRDGRKPGRTGERDGFVARSRLTFRRRATARSEPRERL